MSAAEALDYLAVLSGMTRSERKKRVPELLERVNLTEQRHLKVRAMSGGMKRRLGIAQALLNRPRLLVLDEPTAGLDPKERVRFRNMIQELGKESIVLLSTHIVSDIEHIADRIIMMEEGKLIYQGKWDDGMNLEEFYLGTINK